MREPAATALALAAGALAAPALLAIVEAAAGRLAAPCALLVRRASAAAEGALRPLRRASAEGVAPTDRERRRLQALGALAGLAAGWAAGDALAGLVLAALCGWLASRSLVWRRSRYRRRLEQGAPTAALALADALAGGHSVRGALTLAGQGLEGPIGVELRRVGRELEVGAPTDAVLDELRVRARSRRVELIAAAIRIQRRSGGDLASLLRRIAATLAEQERLEDEARAASAQARFTSVVVLCLPLFGLGLAELASPGMLGRMTGSVAGVWLVGCALLLQLVGALAIRRLGRIAP